MLQKLKGLQPRTVLIIFLGVLIIFLGNVLLNVFLVSYFPHLFWIIPETPSWMSSILGRIIFAILIPFICSSLLFFLAFLTIEKKSDLNLSKIVVSIISSIILLWIFLNLLVPLFNSWKIPVDLGSLSGSLLSLFSPSILLGSITAYLISRKISTH